MRPSAYTRRHEVSIARQLAALAASPSVVSQQLDHHGLRVELNVQPDLMARTYRLAIALLRGRPPSVRVLDPDLTLLAGDRKLPHVYTHTHPIELCLYLPQSGQWSRQKLLAHTVLPWAMEWLVYFECWLLTDEWRGGGVHPGDPDAPRGRRRDRRRAGQGGPFPMQPHEPLP